MDAPPAAAAPAADAQQRRADEPRDELGHDPLAPEEVPGVVELERRQPLERTQPVGA
jgi:hypothetical protein